MARPTRIEFPGALYHVSTHGLGGRVIFADDMDREAFISVLHQAAERFNWRIHAWCELDDHYRILVETPQANLSKGMRQLNGVYTQRYNQRHRKDGSLFQGRFKAVLVEREPWFMEMARDVVYAPVRAGLVKKARDWRWSNLRATAGGGAVPSWLIIKDTLSSLSKRRMLAFRMYQRFVSQAKKVDSPLCQVRKQVFLGSDEFIAQTEQGIAPDSRRSMPIEYYKQAIDDRDEAIFAIYMTGKYSMKRIGDEFDLHYSTVSRIIQKMEKAPSER